MAEIAPTPDDLRDLATYQSLMWALSRPGVIKPLPEPGMPAIIATLLDRETRVYVQEPALMQAVLATGAIIAELEEADHVLFGRAFTPEMLRGVQLGSDLYPDDGASVFLPARFGTGQRLRLRGPGIETTCEVTVQAPVGLWETRAAIMRYPMGCELFLIDDDQIMALPRSTSIEVL